MDTEKQIIHPYLYIGLPFSDKKRRITLQEIEATVLSRFGVTMEDMRSRSRGGVLRKEGNIVLCRKVFCYIVFAYYNKYRSSNDKIGKSDLARMLNKDHCSIIYYLRQAENDIKYNKMGHYYKFGI